MSKLIYLSDPASDFEKDYIALREKEGRVLSDEQVKKLPYAGFSPRWKREWKVRRNTAINFSSYLNKHSFTNLLDVGCGNGWFTHMLSTLPNLAISAVDINKTELEQAVRVFGTDKINFYYGDLFKDIFNEKQFDIIVLNACVQYFPNFKALINRLNYFLSDKGEIHILDSPFYPETEILNAKLRTQAYYRNLGFPEMVKHYYHHSQSDLIEVNAEYIYLPKKNFLSRLLGMSPFPWLRIKKLSRLGNTLP